MLQETASKEAAMATRMEEVQAELKQARLALSNTHAEIDRLGVFSTQLKKVSLLLFPGFSSMPECSGKNVVPVIFQRGMNVSLC